MSRRDAAGGRPATRLTESIERWGADPASADSTPSVHATVLNGHARLSSGRFNWESDVGTAVGGEDLAPSPTTYLLGALAGCGVLFLRDALAPEFGVALTTLEATAACRANIAGLLGVEGADPALGDITLHLRLASPGPDDRVADMLAAWRERCPIYLALGGSSRVTMHVERCERTA